MYMYIRYNIFYTHIYYIHQTTYNNVAGCTLKSTQIVLYHKNETKFKLRLNTFHLRLLQEYIMYYYTCVYVVETCMNNVFTII